MDTVTEEIKAVHVNSEGLESTVEFLGLASVNVDYETSKDSLLSRADVWTCHKYLKWPEFFNGQGDSGVKDVHLGKLKTQISLKRLQSLLEESNLRFADVVTLLRTAAETELLNGEPVLAPGRTIDVAGNTGIPVLKKDTGTMFKALDLEYHPDSMLSPGQYFLAINPVRSKFPLETAECNSDF